MKYLIAMILALVTLMAAPVAYATEPLPWDLVLPLDGTVPMPTFATSTAFDRSIAQNPLYAGQSIYVTSWFADFFAKGKHEINYQLLNVNGKSRRPFPDCTYPGLVPGYGCAGTGCTGFTNIWYEKGLPSGRCYMPANTDPYLYNIIWLGASPIPRSSFKQDWLQTDPRWKDHPYGRNGCSTMGAYTCCARCASQQLMAWGFNVTTISFVDALMNCKDGFAGKRGLSVNWSAVQRIWGCGFVAYKPIKEMLERGMTTQAGLSHDSDGSAGHWGRPKALANKPGSYLMDDSMGRGIIDTEPPRYNDPRDDGFWETDTRSLYRKSYDFMKILQPPATKSASNVMATPIAELPKFSKDDLIAGRVAPLLYYWQQAETLATTQTEKTSSAPLTAPQSQTAMGVPDEDTMVDWSYEGVSAFTAWTQSGDVRLVLKQSDTIVAKEHKEVIENDITDEVVTDLVLETNPLKGGTYTFEISGAPGTAFEVQTYRYQNGEEPVDELITGTIDASGIFSKSFTHMASALVYDSAGLQYIPAGNRFLLVKTNVTTKLSNGQYATQSQYPIQLPIKMNYTGPTAIRNFGQYQMRGIIGPSREITITEIASYDGTYLSQVNCPPVFRNTKQLFDNVAGCIYTKIAGKVGIVGEDYFMLDGVRVETNSPEVLEGNMTTICGVADGNAFIANPDTLAPVF